MTDETPAELRVVWSHEPKEGRCYRIIRQGDGNKEFEEARGRAGMGEPIWDPSGALTGDRHGMLLALLSGYLSLRSSYCMLQATVCKPPPRALSAFVAENPGFGTLELMDRRPPTARTHQELHAALCKDPQISWQDAGTIERTRGWYALYGKPEGKPPDPEFVGKTLEELVRENWGFTTEQLRDLLPSPDLTEPVRVAEELASIPGVYIVQRGDGGPYGWFFEEPEPTPDDALVDLVRKHKNATAEALWALHTGGFRKFVEQLRADPRINATVAGYPTTYYPAEPKEPTP